MTTNPETAGVEPVAYCNKCGYYGPVDQYGRHRRPRDGVQCNYTATTSPAPEQAADPLQSYQKFDGVGLHAETIETRARIGEAYLEAYESAVSDPRLKGWTPMDCPSELLLDLLERLLEQAPDHANCAVGEILKAAVADMTPEQKSALADGYVVDVQAMAALNAMSATIRAETTAQIVAWLDREADAAKADMQANPRSDMAPLYGQRMLYYRQVAKAVGRGDHLTGGGE